MIPSAVYVFFKHSLSCINCSVVILFTPLLIFGDLAFILVTKFFSMLFFDEIALIFIYGANKSDFGGDIFVLLQQKILQGRLPIFFYCFLFLIFWTIF